MQRGAVIWVIPASQNPWSEQLIPKNRAQFRNALTGWQEPVCPIGAGGLATINRRLCPPLSAGSHIQFNFPIVPSFSRLVFANQRAAISFYGNRCPLEQRQRCRRQQRRPDAA
ncbi:MAG TPA: hypothetical protein VGF39_05635, partial [Stellaceae bacterium]